MEAKDPEKILAETRANKSAALALQAKAEGASQRAAAIQSREFRPRKFLKSFESLRVKSSNLIRVFKWFHTYV